MLESVDNDLASGNSESSRLGGHPARNGSQRDGLSLLSRKLISANDESASEPSRDIEGHRLP
jgi:hypothetical protein